MEKINIKELSKTKVLCARVFFDNEVYGTDIRFGLGFDCYFEKEGIILKYYNSVKLEELTKQSLAEDLYIPYSEINLISVSISRKPIGKLFLVKPYNYSLDINIEMNPEFCDHVVSLETNTFSMINDLISFLLEKNVHIEDKLNILEKYSGDHYEEIKSKLNQDYDQLREQFNLINFRITDLK